MNSYAAVHYPADAGPAHGLMPYRDFLILHPQSPVRSGPVEVS